MAQTAIPKHIYFLHLGAAPMPDWAARNIADTRAMNPGWEVTVLTDATRLPTPCETFYQNEAPDFGVKGDIDRIWTLHQNGGVYFDWDVVPLRPLGDLLDDCDLCLGFSYNVGACEYPSVAEPAFLAATADHPFLEHWLGGLMPRLDAARGKGVGAWGLTGPGYCTEALNAFLEPYEGQREAGFTQILRSGGAKLLPYTSFYLTSLGKTPEQIAALDYAHIWGAHTWEHSWVKGGTT